ncbi:MAG TPA: hypothetical protein ENI20_11550 [Bacteroides sp.]|nr:hypothetical protein [Bacteroides sp.]
MITINEIKEELFFSFRMLIICTLLLSCSLAMGADNPRKCILVFGSHADDVEQMAGGTFAKYIANGYQGVYVCVMNNLSGNRIEKFPGNWDFEADTLTSALTLSPKMYQVGALETMQIRKEEALRGSEILGSETVFLDFCEPEIWMGRKLIIYGTEEYLKFNPPGRRHVSIGTRYSEDVNVVVDMLREYQPEITIIHTLGGEKLDHGGSAYMMYLAYKKAMSRDIAVGKLWMRVRGWFLDDVAQNNGRGKPDVRIDIEGFERIKYEALGEHLSQKGSIDVDRAIMNNRKPDGSFEEFITVLDYTK